MSDPTTPPAPATPAVAEPTAYRPLSILAVAGLALAGFFTLVVVGGGLIAFLQGNPWLLSAWWAIVPIAAGTMSLVALLRVQRSEGTLAGEKVARWGLTLTVLVGLSYWAYYIVTYLAITHDAGQFTEKFLGKLAAGDEAGAFLLTLSPGERPAENDRLRDTLENRFNMPADRMGKGPFGQFRQSEPARLIALGGKDTTFEPMGVEKWEYTPGSYEVHQLYRVTQPQASYVLMLTVSGREVKGTAGRQWQIIWPQSGRHKDHDPVFTADGNALMSASAGGREYLRDHWLKAMGEGRLAAVYLATLPPDERALTATRVDLRRLNLGLVDGLGTGALPNSDPAAALTRAALFADPDAGMLATLPGLSEFLDGGLVRAEPGTFWAPPNLRDEIIRLARERFRRPDARLAQDLLPDPSANVPSIRREGDRIVMGNDVALRVPADAPRFTVDAQLVVECDAAEAAAGQIKSFRVRSLDLISGKPLPPGSPMREPGGRGPRGR